MYLSFIQHKSLEVVCNLHKGYLFSSWFWHSKFLLDYDNYYFVRCSSMLFSYSHQKYLHLFVMHIQPLQTYMQDVPMYSPWTNFTFQSIQWLHVTFFHDSELHVRGRPFLRGWNLLPSVEKKPPPLMNSKSWWGNPTSRAINCRHNSWKWSVSSKR